MYKSKKKEGMKSKRNICKFNLSPSVPLSVVRRSADLASKLLAWIENKSGYRPASNFISRPVLRKFFFPLQLISLMWYSVFFNFLFLFPMMHDIHV